MEYGNQFSVIKSFYDWCVENNRMDLLSRWNYELNKISPKEVGFKSNKKFYFNCDKNIDHKPEFVKLANVVNSVHGVTCKACGSFAQWCIDSMPKNFIDECWLNDMNQNLDPFAIGKASHKLICLKCHNGFNHFYFTTPHNFINGTHECQVCNGQVVVKGFNDLFTTDPYTICIWDFDKNNLIDPYLLSHGSAKKVWWKCNICGHEWHASICNITKGKGCPECGKIKRYETFIKNKINLGYSFGDRYPELLQFWDYEKNIGITPFEILPNCMTKFWWKCKNGHNIYKSANEMLSALLCGNSGCKYCSNFEVLVGFNDLAITHPDLLIEWNYEKNTDITPQDISFGSTIMVWWKCKKCGYEWKAAPNSRTNRESGCPECARHMATSKLQIKVENYIKNKYGFDILHERDCTIIATNPTTGYTLPYDNDVNVNGIRLIIEVHGEQHYHITEFTKTNAEKRGVTPEEELAYQKYKDEIKKSYAILNKYEYLEIPYYATDKQMYKDLIDQKIQEILNTTTLMCAS